MKSSEKPGLVCGVMVTRSIPRRTKMPNKTSKRPVAKSTAHVGTSGCFAFIANAAAKCPAYTKSSFRQKRTAGSHASRDQARREGERAVQTPADKKTRILRYSQWYQSTAISAAF